MCKERIGPRTSWHRQYHSTEAQCRAGRRQRTGPRPRLNDDQCIYQSREGLVAVQEAPTPHRCIIAKMANYGPTCTHHFVEQPAVARRVWRRDTTSDHRHGSATGLERAGMGGRVDAHGPARNHHDATLYQTGCQGAGPRQPSRACGPRTDDTDDSLGFERRHIAEAVKRVGRTHSRR